jgi:aryl-alcohol dehydrogenase-like predicted oxidoreductase
MIRFCRSTGVGIIPWSPMDGGRLAKPLGDNSTARAKNRSPSLPKPSSADEEIIRRIEKVAKDKNWTMAHVALTWLKCKNTIPIVGMTAVEKVHDIGSLRGKTLDDDEIKYLEEPYVTKAIQGHR